MQGVNIEHRAGHLFVVRDERLRRSHKDIPCKPTGCGCFCLQLICGGGTHHRVGLHDAALYKDNHIADIPLDKLELQLGNAITMARSGSDLAFVEVEVDTIEQLEIVLRLPVDIVLLDNMSVDKLGEAVKLRNNSPNNPLLEASGGITVDEAPAIAATGVDRIAVGGLVHRSNWLDVGLDAIDG